MAMSQAMLDKIRAAKGKYANRGDSKVYKPKEGKTTIRILTGKIGTRTDLDADVFWRDVGVHWIKEDENAKPLAVSGCHEVVYGEACPICNAIEQAGVGQQDDETLNLIKGWKPNKQVLMNALIRSGSDASDTPVILSLSGGTFSEVCNILDTYTDTESGTDPLDAKTGIDLVIERKGKGKNDTKYTVLPAPKSKPVPPEILENLIDLDDYITKEHFRGEEQKALRAIGNITGAPVTHLMPARGSALLTSPQASLAAPVTEEDEGSPTPPPPPRRPAAAAPAAVAATAAQKAAASPKPAARAPAPAPEPEPEAAEGVELTDEEMGNVLGELDSLLEAK